MFHMTLATLSNRMAMNLFKLYFSSFGWSEWKKMHTGLLLVRPQPFGAPRFGAPRSASGIRCKSVPLYSPAPHPYIFSSKQESYDCLKPKGTLVPASSQCVSLLSEI